MTTIFTDIKSRLNTPKQLQPINGIHYAEVLYADDTLLFGTHTHTINKLLHQIQVESGKYNMKLNLDKCINLTINRAQSSIKFMDGNLVPRKSQAVYLGASLTDSVDNHKEVIKRIGEATAIAKKLNLFWTKARTSIKWKLQVLNSIVFSKLLYGLETIQLIQSEQNKLDAFQMELLRRVFRVPPTHIDRSWTNQRVVDTLKERHHYHYVKLSDSWRKKKITLLGHILRAPTHDPMREVLFESRTTTPRIEHIKRVGKPKAHWLLETFQDARDIQFPNTRFDCQNPVHLNDMVAKAQNRESPFTTRRPNQ